MGRKCPIFLEITMEATARPFDVSLIKDEPFPDRVRELAKNLGVDVDAEQLLVERGLTYGNFPDNARVSQALKRIARACPGWEHIDDVERETMDMIFVKFSRVLSGRSLERQHWEDVEGYSRLAKDQCR
jgi:hypothetical protein